MMTYHIRNLARVVKDQLVKGCLSRASVKVLRLFLNSSFTCLEANVKYDHIDCLSHPGTLPFRG